MSSWGGCQRTTFYRDSQDLVSSQPGWFYEGNAVLHPREAEYQPQFVVDGIPLTDNRSPGFGPVIEADDVQSLAVYPAGFPAEYGRKMGGVVEVNTLQDSQGGFHGQVALSGGSFDSAGAFAQGQYAWGKNVFGASASADTTAPRLRKIIPFRSELISTSQYRPADVTLTWLAPFMLSVDFVFVSTSLMPSDSASRQSLVPLESNLRATFYNFLTHCGPVFGTLRAVLEWSKARLRLIVKTCW